MAEREGFDYRHFLQVATEPRHRHNTQCLCCFQGHSQLLVRCLRRPLATSVDLQHGITGITFESGIHHYLAREVERDQTDLLAYCTNQSKETVVPTLFCFPERGVGREFSEGPGKAALSHRLRSGSFLNASTRTLVIVSPRAVPRRSTMRSGLRRMAAPVRLRIPKLCSAIADCS